MFPPSRRRSYGWLSSASSTRPRRALTALFRLFHASEKLTDSEKTELTD
jgi:hypothetical protein